MAISVAWQTVVTVTTSATVYTTPTGTASTFGYASDLVLCNAGTATIFVAVARVLQGGHFGGFVIPAGGSVILTQCQVPPATIISGVQCGASTTSFSIGFATNITYI